MRNYHAEAPKFFASVTMGDEKPFDFFRVLCGIFYVSIIFVYKLFITFLVKITPIIGYACVICEGMF